VYQSGKFVVSALRACSKGRSNETLTACVVPATVFAPVELKP